MAEIKTWALIRVITGMVENTMIWDGEAEWFPEEGFIAVQENSVEIGWSYLDGIFTAPPETPSTPQQILAAQSAKLQAFMQMADTQKIALAKRIAILQDAIDNIGVEGAEEFAATPEEEAEFPVRKTQLTKWKNYSIALGRVTSQPGWAANVTWPVQPVAGMDLTVSAAAPETV